MGYTAWILGIVSIFVIGEAKAGPTPREIGSAIRALEKACREMSWSAPGLPDARHKLESQITYLKSDKRRAELEVRRKKPVTTRTLIADSQNPKNNSNLPGLVEDIFQYWTPRDLKGPGSKVDWTDKFTWEVMAGKSLGDAMNQKLRNPMQGGGPENKADPGYSEFRSKLRKILKESLTEEEFKGLILTYGLDGNGMRTPKEISQHLGISDSQARNLAKKALKKLSGTPGRRIMKLLAEANGTPLQENDKIGVYTLDSLSYAYREGRRDNDERFFDQVPVTVLNLSPTISEKLKTLQMDRLIELADHFRYLFKRSEDHLADTPFTREELTDLYHQLRPIFWGHMDTSLHFLKFVPEKKD